MLPRNHPDRIQIAFDDPRLVALCRARSCRSTLAGRLGLSQLVDNHDDLGDAPGRANSRLDMILTLEASILAGGDCVRRRRRVAGGL